MVLEELKGPFPGLQIRKCNEFHRSIRDEFILECPKDHFGCLTLFEGMEYFITMNSNSSYIVRTDILNL